MNTIIRRDSYGQHFVEISKEAIKEAGFKAGDTVIVDIPMTGGGLVVYKKEN